MPVTIDQLKNREIAVNNINQGLPQNEGVIDAFSLSNPSTSPNYNTVSSPLPTDISGLGQIPTPKTPQADKADELTQRYQDITKSIIGESEYTSTQKETAGLLQLTATQTDLASQIEGLQLKSRDLTNQYNLAAERIQQESEGRGRTAGGVAPLTASTQRKIALEQASIASQALTTQAALSAIQGKIATAQSQVEEAVAKKFGAIKEEKQAIIDNLGILISSGTLTREEQKRAEAQKVIQEAKQAQIAKNEANQKEKGNAIIEILKSKPNLDAETINQINNAPDAISVYALANQKGIFTEKTADPAIISEYKFYAYQEKALGKTPLSFNGYQNLDANRKISIAKASSEGLTLKQKFDGETSLANSFERYAAGARSTIQQIELINNSLMIAKEQIANGGSINAASQGVLVAFQKMLDPTSVVRESEYARSGNGQSLIQNLEGKYQKLLQGGAGVTIEGLQEFVDTANVFAEGYKASLKDQAERTVQQANNYGLNIENILRPTDIELLNKIDSTDNINVFNVDMIPQLDIGAEFELDGIRYKKISEDNFEEIQ